MNRVIAAFVLALSGCSAQVSGVTAPPVPATAPARAPEAMAPARAAFAAARPGLRRIGYRNCSGFSMELFAPARVSRSGLEVQSFWWVLRSYQPARHGAVRLTTPDTGRLEQRAGQGWQQMPRDRFASVDAVDVPVGDMLAGAVIRLPMASVMGLAQGSTPEPGSYRFWSERLYAQGDLGPVCNMSPMWQFDLEQ